MKKTPFLIVLCSLFLLASCCKEEERTSLDLTNSIGEWVYDHPEEGIWETMKFTSSGIFYFSNRVDTWNIQNDKNDGRYFLDGANITGTYFLNGVSMNLNMTVSQITNYSFTARFNDTGLNFTYAKLLGTVKIKPGQTMIPDYATYVSVGIKGYSSHKPNMVTVNATTGEITAIRSGRTYIDVITDEGTTVLEVTSFDADNLFSDYSWALGMTIPEVVSREGNDYYYRDDTDGLIYLSDEYLIDTLKYFTGIYDKIHVEFVQLDLNNNLTSSQIVKTLKKKYELISEDESSCSFLTGQTIDDLPVTIIYRYNDKESQIVWGLLQPFSLWTDFKVFFGRDKDYMRTELPLWGYNFMFSDYSYSRNGSDYYKITDSEYAAMVGFVFNTENKMCEYWVYLFDDVRQSDVYTYLNTKYVQSVSERTSTQYVFYDKTRRQRIVFDKSGYVSYTDSEQKPFVNP